MSLQSIEWAGWAAVAVASYWLVPARWQNVVLVAVTTAFLAWYSPVSLLLLSSVTALTYLTMTKGNATVRTVRLVVASIVALFGACRLLQSQFPSPEDAPSFLFPVGLAYYALRAIHYTMERFKGTLQPHGFFDFVSYQFFFPTIAAGPIHRFREFHRDSLRRRWDSSLFSKGLERILYGYASVIVLGNFLVSQVLSSHIAPHLPSGTGPTSRYASLYLYADMWRHGLNLYFQFAGYSSIAVGLSMLFGYRVIENFNYPFLRENVSTFWQSWHISLTSWCRDYVYMPVISITRSPTSAAIATMVAMAFWHEVSWRYLIWGFYHGAGIAAWQLFQKLKPGLPNFTNNAARLLFRAGAVTLTVHFILFGFAIVQTTDLSQTLQRWQIMFGFQ